MVQDISTTSNWRILLHHISHFSSPDRTVSVWIYSHDSCLPWLYFWHIGRHCYLTGRTWKGFRWMSVCVHFTRSECQCWWQGCWEEYEEEEEAEEEEEEEEEMSWMLTQSLPWAWTPIEHKHYSPNILQYVGTAVHGTLPPWQHS